MDIQLKILLLSFGISVVLGLLIIPVLKKFKVGQIERDDGPESHLSKQGTPTMGGVIIVLLLIIMSILMFFFFRKSKPDMLPKIMQLTFITIGFGLVGLVDDFKKLVLKNTKGLKPMYKMLGLLLIAVAYTIYLVKFSDLGTTMYLPIMKTTITLPIWLYVPFAILVLLGTTNAVNLTDGIDGLASSVSTIILTCLVSISIIMGVEVTSVFGAVVIGGCLGFLLFNLHPAKVFMGDTGSLLLGGAISGIALYLRMPLILLIIALVPIIETLSVIIQVAYFKKTGKRIFKMAPIHHHFELSGWKEEKVVSVFSIVTLVLCIIGIAIV